jgi:hypothetical protein
MILVGLLKKSCFNFCWKSKFEGREINCKNPLDSSPNKSRLLYSRVVRKTNRTKQQMMIKQHIIQAKEGFWGKWKFVMTIKDKGAAKMMMEFFRRSDSITKEGKKKYFRYKFQ